MVQDWLNILIIFVRTYCIVSYICLIIQTLFKMKHKLLYFTFSFLILITTTGFGFLESSTIIQGNVNRHHDVDSVKSASYGLQFSNNPSLTKKELKKPVNDQIAKSIIQSMAYLVKNITQIIFNLIIEAGMVILMAIFKFFMG